ncbi:histidine kinase [Sphaerisporangium sp. TRM90804]|uniref:sensor histidine kinase n=1 Tax=Sphaerisporangium sp. TRM90804 TaxID=3031113 RepID=UPI00244D3DE1|nr:histidine kinase [Sphaerisporangium sp. TRM90804]MDH2427129.1 histidine kinase [Sphaerisporangium sp. TRM90804]
MRVRAVVGPLVSGATYRRGVYLLLGAVLLLPYVLAAAAFVQLLTQPATPPGLALILLAMALVVGGLPPFLRGTRALEIAAARSLLGVPLPDPPARAEAGRQGRETRLRAALWFGVHLVTGGVVALLVLIPLTMGLALVARLLGVAGLEPDALSLGPLGRPGPLWQALLGVGLLLGVPYAVAGLGALAAVMAPVLLGPSTAERIAVLEARAARLAERNRVARELHDSIGHALTVTTLQASAALELLDSDPEFARRALTAIEDVGRAAAEDLDHVLGMLREDRPAGGGRRPASPSPDARPGEPGATTDEPDAGAGEPSARPGTPEAGPGTPEAGPGAPGAGPGGPGARRGGPGAEPGAPGAGAGAPGAGLGGPGAGAGALRAGLGAPDAGRGAPGAGAGAPGAFQGSPRAGRGGPGARPVGPDDHRLADLDRLVAHSRGTGIEVRAEVGGPVAGLAAPVSREGYRIIQESLTNVLRHAGPVPVALRVTVDDRTLVIDVANPVTRPSPRHAGGRGLDGMRERVTLLGGAMTAGPDGDRWRVSVRLPAGGAAAEPGPAGEGTRP